MGDLTVKADRPTLELLDDVCAQAVRALSLGLVHDLGGRRPDEMTEQERNEALEPHSRRLEHCAAILRDVVRQAAALGEGAVLEEMNRLGVERDLLSVYVEGRRTR